MTASVKLGAVAAVLLAYAGCAVSTEPSESDVLGTSRDVSVAVDPTDDSRMALRAEKITTAGAELRSSFAPSARETVCVSYDGDLDFVRIDEFECTTVRDPHGGGWVQSCGGCTMKFRVAASGKLFFAAEYDLRCQPFAGTYMLNREVTAQACGVLPPETLMLQPKCELGGDELAKCQSEAPAYAREYPEPY